MRTSQGWPDDPRQTHQRLLDLVASAMRLGHEMVLRFVSVQRPGTDQWRPAFGRIDIARPEDLPEAEGADFGHVHLLSQRSSGNDFMIELQEALAGKDLLIAGAMLTKLGMERRWYADRLTGRDWRWLGTKWPCFHLSTDTIPDPVPDGYGLLESGGRVYRDVRALVRELAGPGPVDAVAQRIHLLLWDDRGRIDQAEQVDDKLVIKVSPPDHEKLKLIGNVMMADGSEKPICVDRPSTVDVPLRGHPYRIECELRHGKVTIDEWFWQATEHGDDAQEQEPERVGMAAEIESWRERLTFMRADDLRHIAERDLGEIAVAHREGLNKSVLLLCGSVLEAVLLDVLRKNDGLAQSSLKKKNLKWPDDASLLQLIEIAAKTELRGHAVAPVFLLSKSASGMAGTVTEHRDLIHPHAELRGGIKVDADAARGMTALVGLVLRDLADAASDGRIQSYEAGEVHTK